MLDPGLTSGQSILSKNSISLHLRLWRYSASGRCHSVETSNEHLTIYFKLAVSHTDESQSAYSLN